jgi:cell wall-associated NlpC family hydrolase
MHSRRSILSRWTGLALAAVAVLSIGPVAVDPAPAVAAPAPHTSVRGVPDNFWLVTPSGSLETYGVPSYGSPAGPLNRPLVTAVADHAQTGYWLVASDGGVFSYGSAKFYGSTGNIALNQPIVGLGRTPDELGYWLVARDGGVFSYGDAAFYGSTGNLVLNQPIVGMASTPDGRGYWLVASDGGVFSFGDAAFYGSTGSLQLRQPIVGMSRTADGHGYWLVARDGGVFAFGDAGFYGSAAGTAAEPVAKIVPASGSAGYWIVQQNGTAQAFGSATGQSISPQALLLQPLTPGDEAVLFAFQQLGKPYIWGGNGPAGYDCSGLALASWVHGAGVSFARVANDQYHTAGTQITFDQLEAGDLVFWGTDPNNWTTVYHAAIYVGGGRIVEATGNHVQLNTLDQWSMNQVMPFARRP